MRLCSMLFKCKEQNAQFCKTHLFLFPISINEYFAFIFPVHYSLDTKMKMMMENFKIEENGENKNKHTVIHIILIHIFLHMNNLIERCIRSCFCKSSNM